MRWLFIAAGIVACAALIVVIIGALLPVAHTATRSAEVPAAPNQIWTAITDVSAFPTWRPDIVAVEQLPAGSWRERGRNGAITYQTTASAPPNRLVVRIVDKTLPFGGEWEYSVARGHFGR
jgi:uncharacterized protein YndB with AHSA1/START domain